MVSKVMPAAGSFYHTCRYVCQDLNRARILDAEGVRDHDYRLIAEDFERQREFRPEKQKAVFHSVLSYFPGEKPTDAQMVEIGRKYLEQIGLGDSQYLITRHLDKDHAHMHIIANRVDNQGKSIDDSWIGLKAKKVSQKLTQEYRLTQALEKNLKLTHRENLNESETRRYRIYDAVTKSLPKCHNLEELERRLLKQGIDVQYRTREGRKERMGISFRLEKECFKGSQIDREFSIKKLEETLALQQKLDLHEELSMEHHHSHHHGHHM